MDTFLLLLALLLQAADAAVTCDRLQRGWREVNPLLGQSCPRAIALKTAAYAAVPLVPNRVRRAYLVGLAAGGAAGLTVTLVWGDR